MPIYEYFCPENNTLYTFLAKSISQGGSIPRCPHNPAWTMQKQYSAFSVTGATRKADRDSEGGEVDSGMDDPRMLEAMASLEQEMSGLDEENPDPRQMGHLMRKMADITGQKLPATMEEMVRRMEGGEDPEKLEEEFEDALDALDSEMTEDQPGGIESAGNNPGEGMIALQVWRRLKGPRRDPKLYDLAEYLD